ncbi:MAG: lysine biosynthesis protein LysW [Candidatus Micrarchaeia archaeon]
MPPQARCPECGQPLELADPKPGDVITCPNCGLKLKVVIVTKQFVRFETLEEESEF